jgi:hypothetical protein
MGYIRKNRVVFNPSRSQYAETGQFRENFDTALYVCWIGSVSSINTMDGIVAYGKIGGYGFDIHQEYWWNGLRFRIYNTGGVTYGGFWDDNTLIPGTYRVYEVVWDRTNGILLCFVNGYLSRAHGVKRNDNLKTPLANADDCVIRIARDWFGNYRPVGCELLVIDNKLPWWYRYIDYSDENEYRQLEHFLYLDPDNPIPIGTKTENPSNFLHCYLFDGNGNDSGSNPMNLTLYNEPSFETGYSGVFENIELIEYPRATVMGAKLRIPRMRAKLRSEI